MEEFMTREDIQDLLAMIQGAYPNFNPANKTATINAWTMALEDCSKNQIALAFKAYLRTNNSGFAPSPGQLIEQLQTIAQPMQMNELEAWALVSKAVRNSAYNSESEFNKLPELVQKALGSSAQLRIWAMDEEYNESVNSSNFMRAYRTLLEREKQISKMPEQLKTIMRKKTMSALSDSVNK